MLVEAAAPEGVLQPIIWNLILFMFSFGKNWGCAYVGMWGLFWYNDGGEMIEACMNTGMVGGAAEYAS